MLRTVEMTHLGLYFKYYNFILHDLVPSENFLKFKLYIGRSRIDFNKYRFSKTTTKI
jgi:hypothetical protein